MIEVRDVTVDDAEGVTQLLRALVSEQPPVALELEPLIMKGKEWIAQFPKGQLGIFVVAEDEHRIVGFCYLAVPKFYKPIAYIGLAVEKEYRRHSTGSRLFYHAAEWASQQQLQYIIADIWAWNKKSIHFFENLGFIEKETFQDKFKGEMKDKKRMVKKL